MTLVDTGLWRKESFVAIEVALREHGMDFSDLDQIVLTHMHGDHSGGVSSIQNRTSVDIVVHENARHTITGGKTEFARVEEYFEEFFRVCGAEGKVTRNQKYHEEHWENVSYVKDGDVLAAGGREYQIVYAPGHSQTDIVLWHVPSGDAIVGDHLLKDISANAFLEPRAPGDKARPRALLQYRESMQRTRALPFGRIYPGHGQPYTGHQQLIDARFQEHDERCEAILEQLALGNHTIYDISRAMFPWLKENAVFLGLSEILGHMDLLVEQSRVRVDEREGVQLFYAP